MQDYTILLVPQSLKTIYDLLPAFAFELQKPYAADKKR